MYFVERNFFLLILNFTEIYFRGPTDIINL